MSHVEQATIRIMDLTTLMEAVEAIVGVGRAKLVDAETYNCFPSRVGDYPLPKGMTEDEWGKCEKKIVVDGINYEVGLVRDKEDRSAWMMRYDFWGPGQRLKEHFGDKLGKLSQKYQELKITKALNRQAGRVLSRTMVGKSVQLTLQVMA